MGPPDWQCPECHKNWWENHPFIPFSRDKITEIGTADFTCDCGCAFTMDVELRMKYRIIDRTIVRPVKKYAWERRVKD